MMLKTYSDHIAKRLDIEKQQVLKTIELLDQGATIPFISRYRKEITGGLDEVAVEEIKSRYEKLSELTKRKQTVLQAIEEQGKLSPELKKRIDDCWNTAELEDIYLPYKPKRQTRAEIARKKGLEPLAKILIAQTEKDPLNSALSFLNLQVQSAEEALHGARDIIAEWVNENEYARNIVRNRFHLEAVISSKVIKGKENDAAKYRDYFEFSEPLARCHSHRLLAMRRGEAEELLRITISPDDDRCLEALLRKYLKARNGASEQVEIAVKDAYKRLIKPSVETEFAASSKEKADEQAIKVFAANLKQLLLAPPLGPKRVLGIDPGFRTGCKLVCLDDQGNLLHNETIYPHPPQNEKSKAAAKITLLVQTYNIQAVAIGNGTAGRETEGFISGIRYDRKLQIFVVSEDGASVYSASKTARDEFPEYDVTVRGAVSIARRLIDPLSELVKIDPKAIGVGQYQHDVEQGQLKKSLDQTVINCVNLVGVNLNTAGKHLLTYVSGLGPALAQNIIEYRTVNGPFKSRKQLMKVPKLGEKTFEQCAGFLRIPEAENPLDNTAVHPESYDIVEAMARDLKASTAQLIADRKQRDRIKPEKYLSPKTGMPTLLDIIEELDKPGRDPRKEIQIFEFDSSVKTIDDLKELQILPGIVTNITNFGCFVDIGIKEKGLVHISEMANRFISNPAEVVSMHQHVKVKIMSIDKERKRIQLSLKTE